MKLTLVELRKLVGAIGRFKVPIHGATPTGFIVPVKLLDARSNYGRVDYLIEPIDGSGCAWVSSEAVTLNCLPI